MHRALALLPLKLSALAFTVLIAAFPGIAQTEAILHTFNNNGRDGAVPYAGMVRDSAGNLYGTTGNWGSGTACGGNCGTVFELTPRTTGGWSEKIIHSFNNNGHDGFES